MKRKNILLIAGLVFIMAIATGILVFRKSASNNDGNKLYRVPRVLIITTGKDGTGTLPEGVLLAMESFISHGAYARVNTRDALLDREYLAGFDILLMLTAIEYHDADRQYSLTFFEDLELEIIRKWVEDGGVLIAGDNIGRNLRNGADRISIYGRLEPDNWPLSACFGVMMSERNMEGFALYGDLDTNLRGELLPVLGPGSWILVPDSLLSENATILASWQNDSAKFPAMIMNFYGKGISILLPSSYLLHPSNEGGIWNAVQIDAFFQRVLKEFYQRFPLRVGMSPWPDAHPAAFAVSLNSDGKLQDYRHVFSLLAEKKVAPSLFVNGVLEQNIRDYLATTPHQLQSNGWRKTNMRDLTFSETVFQVELNEQEWDRDFSGFRFPYTLNSVWGMDFLQRKGYSYESSIGTDHTEAFYGSLFPYHLPVFQGQNYQVLDLLEISPVARDDYFYFRMIQEEEVVDPVALEQKAQVFSEYLRLFWKQNALARGGMMVYLGHPLFTGYNDTTSVPLSRLLDTVSRDNAWITTMEDIATRWRLLDEVIYTINKDRRNPDRFIIGMTMKEGTVLKGATLKLFTKPSKATAKTGQCHIKQKKDHWLLIFDAMPDQEITVWL